MHNICYRSFPASTSRNEIISTVQHIVSTSGDGYGTEHVIFHPVTICDDYEAAKEFLHQHSNGFYPGTAVKYHDLSNVASSKQIEALLAKISETRTARHEYIAAHSVKNFKADYVGCQECGSKLSRVLLGGDFCPLCRNDLRSATTIARIARYDAKIKELEQKIRQERLKQKDKAKVCWLVMFEYHS